MKCRMACLQVEEDAARVDRDAAVEPVVRRVVQEERTATRCRRSHARRRACRTARRWSTRRSTSSPCVTSVRTNVIASFAAATPRRLLVDVGDHDLRALRRESLEQTRVPDAAGTAGDDRDAAVEPVRDGRADLRRHGRPPRERALRSSQIGAGRRVRGAAARELQRRRRRQAGPYSARRRAPSTPPPPAPTARPARAGRPSRSS